MDDGRSPTGPGHSGCTPSPGGLGHTASVPNAVWKPFAEQYSLLFTDGALEALAKAIGPLIVEEYDGEPYGASWDKMSERDKTPVRFIAQRGLRALTSYTYAERSKQDRQASAIEARSDATGTDAAEGESAVGNAETHNDSGGGI